MSGGKDPIGLAHVLDIVCPMHVLLDGTGHIRHAGPSFQKLRPDKPFIGQRLMEVMELRRPRASGSMASLLELEGQKLHFALRAPPRTELKGVLVALPDREGAVLNLSFGISIVEAVRDYALTGADFAATDLTVEMLYLVEAKSAAMEELRRLNMRLNGARRLAEEQAHTDKLTGLKNRRAMDAALSRVVGAGEEFALVHLDLDRFKQVNDTFGHAAGDQVLQTVARRMTAATREADTLIRVGGDEFLLLLPDFGGRKRLVQLAERLIREIERPIPFGDNELTVSASIGASLSSDYDMAVPECMMDDADTALYAAKAAGRRGFRIYSGDLGRMGGGGGGA